MKKLLLAAVVSLVVPNVSYGQAPDPRPGATVPVQVVNPPDHPVPVTGTVTGTVSVEGSVSVSNTPNVNVVNQPEVKLADNPALQPVTLQFHGSINTTNVGVNFPDIPTFYTVPAGKRLVIEYVDATLFLSNGNNSGKFSLTLFDYPGSGAAAQHPVGVSSESIQCSLTQTCIFLNRLQRVYVDSGHQLFGDGLIVAALAANFSSISGTVNGYLVDVP